MREMKKSKKANISLRRRVTICYQRFMLLLKLSLLIFVCLFVFTDLFKIFKDNIRATFYEISANYGFVLQNVIIDGQNAADEFGNAVASAGDFNGDGKDDVIIGAPADDNNSNNNSGSAFIFFGGITGTKRAADANVKTILIDVI